MFDRQDVLLLDRDWNTGNTKKENVVDYVTQEIKIKLEDDLSVSANPMNSSLLRKQNKNIKIM